MDGTKVIERNSAGEDVYSEQLPQIADRRIRHDLQPMLDVRGHGGAAHARDEVHGAHAGALRAVDVDVEVVPDEERLRVVDAEAFAERGEDRRPRLADAVLVGEDHGVDVWRELELVEDFAQRGAGRAAGVADQSEAVAARLQL